MKRLIKLLIVLLLLTGAAFSAGKMLDMAGEYLSGRNTYEQVKNEALSYTALPQSSPSAPEAEPEEGQAQAADEAGPAVIFPLIDFKLLEAQNSDVVGWVCIEGTNINYPVVQGEDNRHYVSTLFDGSVNQAGSIFMDFRNNADMSDVHTVLYGHNMQDKSMFADILNYQSQEYYDAHPYGMYITAEKNYCFHIVAAYVASLADPAWQLEFAAEEEIMHWLEDAIEKSAFSSNVQISADDKFITLSTCSYEFDDARFVLVGVLDEQGSPEK